jgi:DnaJ-class molecular chaperone
MPAAKKATGRRKTPPPPPAPASCEVCEGTGTVAVTVRVGRRRRVVGKQDGMCLACFGSGTA